MGNYCTVNEIRDKKIAGEKVRNLIKYTDDEIETAIGLAESMIECFTQDIFYQILSTEFLFDGNGQDTLFYYDSSANVTYPVSNVTAIAVVDDDETTVLHSFDLEDEVKVYNYYMKLLKGVRVRGNSTLHDVFPIGAKNISITADWGPATVPAEVKEATALLTLEQLLPGSSGLQSNQYSQVVWSDFTMSIRGTGPENTINSTGFQRVDSLLACHVNYIGMFRTVPTNAQSPYDFGK